MITWLEPVSLKDGIDVGEGSSGIDDALYTLHDLPARSIWLPLTTEQIPGANCNANRESPQGDNGAPCKVERAA